MGLTEYGGCWRCPDLSDPDLDEAVQAMCLLGDFEVLLEDGVLVPSRMPRGMPEFVLSMDWAVFRLRMLFVHLEAHQLMDPSETAIYHSEPFQRRLHLMGVLADAATAPRRGRPPKSLTEGTLRLA